jgi:hypothetical protein
VGTCQGAVEAECKATSGTGSETIKQSMVSQHGVAGTPGAGRGTPGPDDLLLEGEEQEYFLELLMRKASPEQPRGSPPARDEDNPKTKTAPAKGRERKRSSKKERKALKKSQAEGGKAQEREVEATGQISNQERQGALDLLNNPEAKGRGLVDGDRRKKSQGTRPHTTSGGECSRQKTPDYS